MVAPGGEVGVLQRVVQCVAEALADEAARGRSTSAASRQAFVAGRRFLDAARATPCGRCRCSWLKLWIHQSRTQPALGRRAAAGAAAAACRRSARVVVGIGQAARASRSKRVELLPQRPHPAHCRRAGATAPTCRRCERAAAHPQRIAGAGEADVEQAHVLRAFLLRSPAGWRVFHGGASCGGIGLPLPHARVVGVVVADETAPCRCRRGRCPRTAGTPAGTPGPCSCAG